MLRLSTYLLLAVFALAFFAEVSGSCLTAAYAQQKKLDRFTICLLKNSAEVEVEGVSIHFFDDELGLLIGQSEGRRRHVLRASNDGLSIDGVVYDTERIRLRSTKNWLSYEGRIYRQDMIVVRMPDNPKRLALVNEIQLEQYLYGLINKEALSSWPLEAKKAQAVAARTYALHKKINHPKPICDLASTAVDQVYGGYSHEDNDARLAVDSTHGEVLVSRNRIAKTFYHSTCGGKTASSASIWLDPQSYLTSRACPYCKDSPAYRWEYEIDKKELGRKLRVPSQYMSSFQMDIPERDESGRVQKLRLRYGSKTRQLTGERLRKAVGYGNLKSSAFSFRIKRGRILFFGKGFGHGVGMCQWGAAGMAKQGSDYRRILEYYYPGTKLRRVY